MLFSCKCHQIDHWAVFHFQLVILCSPDLTWQKDQQIGDSKTSVLVQHVINSMIPFLSFNSWVFSSPPLLKRRTDRRSKAPFQLHLKGCPRTTNLYEDVKISGGGYWSQTLYSRAKLELEARYILNENHRKITKENWMEKQAVLRTVFILPFNSQHLS